MKHVLSFEHENAPYQVMELDTLGRVQLWYMNWSGHWVIGHGKDIPSGWTAETTANNMRDYIAGEMTQETYNHLLPR